MPSEIHLGSPWPPEKRQYLAALTEWFKTSAGFPPERPHDPLKPFREAAEGCSKRQISMRVDQWVIDLTKKISSLYEMPYQKIFRGWIEEGLRRSVQEGSPTAHPGAPEEPSEPSLRRVNQVPETETSEGGGAEAGH